MNMRYSISLAVLAVATLLSFPGTARAAMMDGPPGSYLDTCRDVHMRGDTLVAKCQKVDNHWRDTSLDDVYRCVGDIANLDGRLQCSRTPTRPAGDYAETCRDVRMRVNTLYAKCKTMDGYWVETQLDGFSRCRGPISNVNGQLRCGDSDWDRDRDRDRDRGWGYGPRGSYRETCRDVRVDGDRLRARCESMDGYWRDTSLDDYNRCEGGIVNDDGNLRCTRAGGRRVPAGSYTETCSRIYVNGDTLRAYCSNDDGRWAWTQLNDWDDCRGGIWNEDGRLRCRRD